MRHMCTPPKAQLDIRDEKKKKNMDSVEIIPSIKATGTGLADH